MASHLVSLLPLAVCLVFLLPLAVSLQASHLAFLLAPEVCRMAYQLPLVANLLAY